MAGKSDVVHSDPDVLSGTPVFVGTRVPVQSLFDYLEAGDTLDEFLHQFPSVSREQTVAALELARERTRREQTRRAAGCRRRQQRGERSRPIHFLRRLAVAIVVSGATTTVLTSRP